MRALGGVGVLTLLTLGICIYLVLLNRSCSALFTLAAIGGGWLISNLLKLGFERPRPDLFPHDVILYTASFSSGHAMVSAVMVSAAWAGLCWLAALSLQQRGVVEPTADTDQSE
jgi:membrane-associated phospholipid phosphatase